MRVSDFLYNIIPKQFFKLLQRNYHALNKKMHKPITKERFFQLLSEIGIKKGDVVFVHSSLDKMNLAFSANELLSLLIETVGDKGTLLFPAWTYLGRTEDFARQEKPTFDRKKSFTTMGILPELARRRKDALRSLHPTSSVTAIGKYAEMLIKDHHLSEHPCDENSPFYKMMNLNAKIIGLGERTISLSFVHCVEDIMKNDFPLKVNYSDKFDFIVIDYDGTESISKAYIHRPNKQQIPQFVSKYINKETCRDFKKHGINFFYADAKPLFDEMHVLARKGITIYN